MTMTSTPVTLDQALDIAEERAYNKARPAFPPIDDFFNFLMKVNWERLGNSTRLGVSNLLWFAMKFSEKSYDFHEFLYDKICTTDATPDLEV